MRGRTFRVFVSSTFSDLKAERNGLAKWVFPRLRALAESRGYKFQAVDLRWGVRDEAGLDQQTVRICLDEIARCQRLSPRPNFIVLLGDRYGWCPPPSTIPADEVERMRPFIETDVAGNAAGETVKLVFGDPDAPENADPVARHGWYRRDENAVPAEYVLQPRRGTWEAYETWRPVERRLRETLATAAERAGLGEAARRKYRASATELEIMKGAVEAADVREHVFAFFRTISKLDDVKAALPAAAAKDLIDTRPPPDETWDRDAWKAQQRLKELLADRIGEANVWRCEAEWNGGTGALDLSGVLSEIPASLEPSAADTDLPETKDLCEAVWQRLSRVIVREMDTIDGQSADPLEVEKRRHADFGEERQRGFIGRAELLARIAGYLKTGTGRPLVIHGPLGSGKSALIARAIAEARAAHPGTVVVERFVGASPGASEIRPLLESICQEIARAFGGDRAALGDYAKLVAELPRRLALATEARPLVVFLDALDLLGETDEARLLAWLPRALPLPVRIVVTALEDETASCYRVLRAAANDGDFARLEPLTKDEGYEILRGGLEGPREADGRSRASRRLTDGQVAIVLAKFAKDGSPLYLNLASKQARRWHSYDGDQPAASLPVGTSGMIRAFLAWLVKQHGEVLVDRVVGNLAAARDGLSDQEMLDLLWLDDDVKRDFDRGKHHELPDGAAVLPPIVWSRLYFDLEPYLTEREVFAMRVVGFYHRQFADVSAARLASGHLRLASYFAKVPLEFGSSAGRIPNLRKLSELPYHLLAARDVSGLGSLIRSNFLERKSEVVGDPEAASDAKSIAEALAAAGDGRHEDLVLCANLYCTFVERVQSRPEVLQDLIRQGKVQQVLRSVESEPSESRRGLLALAVSVLLADSGFGDAASKLADQAMTMLPEMVAPGPARAFSFGVRSVALALLESVRPHGDQPRTTGDSR